MSMFKPSRRRFISQSALGLAAFAGMPGLLRAMEGARGMSEMPKMKPNIANPNFNPDVEIDLHCRNSAVQILPGAKTNVMQYSANLVKGPKGTVTEIPGSFLGPLIRLQKGQRVRIRLHNHLAEPTITHWHGLHVPVEMDGHPRYAIDPGVKYVYEFEVLNRAGMNIYHPHPHEATAKQVYHGMAGALFVHDQEEAALELPSGEFEIPLVIQDKRFTENNQLVYAHMMHDRMMGFYGDHILVNGLPNVKLDVASRAYRLRVMNGSTARIYKLAWDDGSPMVVIGTDGGLLEKPETKPYLMLAPGERLDIWADFSGRKEGTELVLRSIEFSGVLPKMAERMMRGGGMGGMGGGMMGGMHANPIPVGSNYPILTIKVTKKVSDSPKLPTQLSKINRYQLQDTANQESPIPIGISEGPMAMLLNGRPYAYNDPLGFEKVKLNTIQLLEIFHAHGGGGGHGGEAKKAKAEHGAEGSKGGEMSGMGGGMGHGMGGGMGMGMMQHGGGDKAKDSAGGGMQHGGGGMGMGMMQGSEKSEGGMGGMGGMGGGMGGMGMMMSMAHPIHLHGQFYQVLSREVAKEEQENYATVSKGFVNSGWKDTVLVMPGEKVRIIKPFQDFKGPFLYHCHNLEHEDMGMMREFWVE